MLEVKPTGQCGHTDIMSGQHSRGHIIFREVQTCFFDAVVDCTELMGVNCTLTLITLAGLKMMFCITLSGEGGLSGICSRLFIACIILVIAVVCHIMIHQILSVL